ncbi:hypothetical protein OROHE_002306 [Orobanche hederae]
MWSPWGILGSTSMELTSITFKGGDEIACTLAMKLHEKAEECRRDRSLKHLQRPKAIYNLPYIFVEDTRSYFYVGKGWDTRLRAKMIEDVS